VNTATANKKCRPLPFDVKKPKRAPWGTDMPYHGPRSQMLHRHFATLKSLGYSVGMFSRPDGYIFSEVRYRGEMVLDVATEGEIDAFVRGLRGEVERNAASGLAALFRDCTSKELREAHAGICRVIGSFGAASDVSLVRRYVAFAELLERRIVEVDPVAFGGALQCRRVDAVNGAGIV
jgi:hypothetical protein